MKIRFLCPVCQYPGRWRGTEAATYSCPQCGHVLTLSAPENDKALSACAVCGNEEVYRKKDFPHWLGISILVLSCLAFLILKALYHQWWAWVILIGSALFDGALYLLVKDVVVCYRCGTHHHGLPSNPDYPPFDLSIAERYRQEQLRRQQVEAERKPSE
ncbi:MAG: hypothetical protein ACK4RK_14040 [Gemmataceae bacterium]